MLRLIIDENINGTILKKGETVAIKYGVPEERNFFSYVREEGNIKVYNCERDLTIINAEFSRSGEFILDWEKIFPGVVEKVHSRVEYNEKVRRYINYLPDYGVSLGIRIERHPGNRTNPIAREGERIVANYRRSGTSYYIVPHDVSEGLLRKKSHAARKAKWEEFKKIEDNKDYLLSSEDVRAIMPQLLNGREKDYDFFLQRLKEIKEDEPLDWFIFDGDGEYYTHQLHIVPQGDKFLVELRPCKSGVDWWHVAMRCAFSENYDRRRNYYRNKTTGGIDYDYISRRY